MKTTNAQFLSKHEIERRLIDLLRGFEFSPAEGASRSDGEVRLSTQYLPDRNGFLIAISAGFPPPESVEGIRLAIKSASGPSIPITAVTDRRGQFIVENPPTGVLTLRLTELTGGGLHTQHVFAHAASSGLAAAGVAPQLQPADRGAVPYIGMDRSDRYLVIRQWADEVPYGVVRVTAQVGDSTLRTWLVPMIPEVAADPSESFCWAETDPMEVRSADDAVDFYVVPATDDSLARFPESEVRALLGNENVEDNAELKASILKLLDKIAQAGAQGRRP